MASAEHIPTFTETWGCQMIAYMLDAFFYGVAMLLVAQYYHSHSGKDSKLIKGTVGALALLASLEFTFISHQMYVDYVERFANPPALDLIVFTAPSQLFFIYLTAFIAQCFFASRIWTVAKKKKFLYTLPILTIALLQISAGIAQTILVFGLGRFSLLHSTVKITSLQSGATAVCDIMITLTLCYILKEAKSGVRRTDGMIDKMILYAINRGVATSLCALLNLILFVSVPNTFIFMIPLVPSCQLYVISVVSMLTTRGALRAELGRGGITTLPGSFPLSTYGGSNTLQSYENQPTIPNTTILTLGGTAVESYSSKQSMV